MTEAVDRTLLLDPHVLLPPLDLLVLVVVVRCRPSRAVDDDRNGVVMSRSPTSPAKAVSNIGPAMLLPLDGDVLRHGIVRELLLDLDPDHFFSRVAGTNIRPEAGFGTTTGHGGRDETRRDKTKQKKTSGQSREFCECEFSRSLSLPLSLTVCLLVIPCAPPYTHTRTNTQ